MAERLEAWQLPSAEPLCRRPPLFPSEVAELLLRGDALEEDARARDEAAQEDAALQAELSASEARVGELAQKSARLRQVDYK